MSDIQDGAVDVPQFVLDAALALHSGRSEVLFLELDSDPTDPGQWSSSLWQLEERLIRFSNIEARNQCSAFCTLQRLMPIDDAAPLFEAAIDLWRNEIGHRDSAAGRLLGVASSNVNVLAAVGQAINRRQFQRLRLFDYLKLVEVALPHIRHIAAEDVVALIDAQHESTKHDLAGGLIYRSIESRLQSDPQLASEIRYFAKARMTESLQNLYGIALQALLGTDDQSSVLQQAKEDAGHSDPIVAGAALWTLSRAIQLHPLTEHDLNECIEVLILGTLSPISETKQSAIRALANASMRDEKLMLELVQLASTYDNYVLVVVADLLLRNHRELQTTSRHFEALLKALIGVPPSSKMAIRNFDCVLHELYAVPEQRPLALDCLSLWVVKHGGVNLREKALIEVFEQTIMQIANDESGFQAIITRWLLAPELELAVACSGLISYVHLRGMKSLAFSRDVLNILNEPDRLLLARRLVGYLISEDVLLSLTFSLLATNDAQRRSFGLAYLLLTEQVGRDFPRATMNALTERLETAITPEKEMLARALSVIQMRNTTHDRLPRLQELRTATRLRRAIALHQTREIEAAQAAANEQSVFRSLFKEVPLKAGRGCFSVSDNQVGPTQHLQSVSHSVSVPLRALTDPVGYAIAGFNLRNSQMDNQ